MLYGEPGTRLSAPLAWLMAKAETLGVVTPSPLSAA